MRIDERAVTEALRDAGARFAFVHGSRAVDGGGRPDSDLDVAAWWGVDPPVSWDVRLPVQVDLLVLDTGPLWLTGRVAQYGQLLFDDDPPRREPVDERWLDAVKYTLVTAIGGCGRVAHHLVVSEGWPIAESNADAIRELASQGVVPRPVVEPVATAVGLRNVLVHQYADVERSPAGHERAGRSPRPR